MAGTTDVVACPFCGETYAPEWSQMLALHVESEHLDNERLRDGELEATRDLMPGMLDGYPGKHVEGSSLVRTESIARAGTNDDTDSLGQTYVDDNDDGDADYVIRPESDCEEPIPLIDLGDHLDLHEVTRPTSLDARANSTSRTTVRSSACSRDGPGRDRGLKRSQRERYRADNSRKGGQEQARVWLRRRAVKRSSPDGSRTRKGDTASRASSSKADETALGPYATEKSMPPDLHARLSAGPKLIKQRIIGPDGRLQTTTRLENHTSHLIDALAYLSTSDPTVETAYFCHPSVQHIQNAKGEGGFCGYRNVQMLMSWMQGANVGGYEMLEMRSARRDREGDEEESLLFKPPTIIDMQNWIETAWDLGMNSQGREEVGRLRGTRKWIGTSEASAIFQLLGVPHDVWQCSDGSSSSTSASQRGHHGQRAHRILFRHVEEYFSKSHQVMSSLPTVNPLKVIRTSLPPIYLQQPGHSLTIVGFERRKSGHCNLVVFDCMYAVPKTVLGLVNDVSRRTLGVDELSDGKPGWRGKLSRQKTSQAPSGDLIAKSMEIFRRDGRRLHRYKEFETLILK